MSQEWSRVVSGEVKEEYMALQGIQTYCSQLTSKDIKTVKSHLSLTLMRVKLVSNNWSLLLSDWCILGLRYIMHRHPWISAFVGVGSNLAMLVMIMLVSWTRFLTGEDQLEE